MAIIKNWKKKKDSSNETVWINEKTNRRVVVTKGQYSYQAWVEKNIGRVASDNAFLKNSYLTSSSSTTKEEAIKIAVTYMKRYTGEIGN